MAKGIAEDKRKPLAGSRERDEITDGAAMLNDAPMSFLRAFNLVVPDQTPHGPVVSRLGRALDLGLEIGRLQSRELLPATGLCLADAKVRELGR